MKLFNSAHDIVHAIGSRPLATRRLSAWMIAAGFAALSASAWAGPSPTLGNAPSLSPERQEASFVSTPHLVSLRLSQQNWVNNHHTQSRVLLDRWEQSGVTPLQAFELINVMLWTQSPVLVTSQEDQIKINRQQRHTQDIYQVNSAESAAQFLNQHSLSSLSINKVIARTEGINSPEPSHDSTWNDVRAYWEHLKNDRLDRSHLPGASIATHEHTPIDMSAALVQLQEAMQESGLRALRIPVPMWDDPIQIAQVAHDLRLANQELQAVTGWNAGVLGLNGRVVLTLGAPDQSSFAYTDAEGTLSISGVWEDVGHEWMHILQNVLQQETHLAPSLDTPISKHGGQWHRFLDHRIQELQQQGPSGQDAAHYLSSPHEMLAYGWGSYVQSALSPGNVLMPHDPQRQVADGVRGPSLADAKDMAPQWQTVLSQINTQWWSPQIQSVQDLVPSPPPMSATSIAARRTPASSPPNPSLVNRIVF